MKMNELNLKKELVIEQLRKFGYTENEGLTYEELKHKLATARALEVDVECSAEKWF